MVAAADTRKGYSSTKGRAIGDWIQDSSKLPMIKTNREGQPSRSVAYVHEPRGGGRLCRVRIRGICRVPLVPKDLAGLMIDWRVVEVTRVVFEDASDPGSYAQACLLIDFQNIKLSKFLSSQTCLVSHNL